MRRVLLTLSFWLLALGFVNAQEAFYIYRNDGDFNGFFYDEVIEMRQSKIGVDSIEYDRWVTQEVVMADTIYRIPLAAIDSIGFQQPEIKLNPKVKFIQKDGLAPYFDCLSYYLVDETHNIIHLKFNQMPENLMPQVGDVLIALPSDSIKDRYKDQYDWTDEGNSFSCVVDRVERYDAGNSTVYGHLVEQIGDVFEQYITVEQIGIDENNQIHRRIAGCSPDGLPYRIAQASGGDETSVIDFSGKVSHSWNIASDSTQVDVAAELVLKLKVRASYNITWSRVLVSIKPEMVAKVKPSVGLSVKREFKTKLSDIIPLPDGIPFPAAAPLFELCPLPTLFMSAEGKLEARLNLPEVGIGVGVDLIVDSKNSFPVSGSVHLVEDEEKKSDDLLDVSGEVTLSGTIYTGVEFQLAINTNSWFKRILQAGIGVHFTAGPKVEAQMSYNSKVLADENAYFLLSEGKLTHTWLSLGLNAGAKGQVGWNDPDEVTFFETGKDIAQTEMHLAPQFEDAVGTIEDDELHLELHPKPGINLLYNTMKVGIYQMSGVPEPTLISEQGNWMVGVVKEDMEFSTTYSLADLKPLYYHADPMIYGPGGPFRVKSAGFGFTGPKKIHLDCDSMHFNAAGEEKSITFTTNCLGDKFGFGRQGAINAIESARIDTLDKQAGQYKLIVKTKPNNKLFADCQFEKGDPSCPSLWFSDELDQKEKRDIAFKQDERDLGDAYIHYLGAVFGGYSVPLNARPSNARFTRAGKDTVVVTQNDDEINFSMRIVKNGYNSFGNPRFICTGSLTYSKKSSTSEETYTIAFENQSGSDQNPSYLVFSGVLTTGKYDYIKYNASGDIVSETHFDLQEDGGNSRLDIIYYFRD